MSSCIVVSCTPCDWSATVSRSGHRVEAMRLRRSTRSSSGTSTVNGRISVALSMVAMPTSISGRRTYDLDSPRPSRQINAATIQPLTLSKAAVPVNGVRQIATNPHRGDRATDPPGPRSRSAKDARQVSEIRSDMPLRGEKLPEKRSDVEDASGPAGGPPLCAMLLRLDELEVGAPSETLDRRWVELSPAVEDAARFDHDRQCNAARKPELERTRPVASHALSTPVDRPVPIRAVRPIPAAFTVNDHSILALALHDQKQDLCGVHGTVLWLEGPLHRDAALPRQRELPVESSNAHLLPPVESCLKPSTPSRGASGSARRRLDPPCARTAPAPPGMPSQPPLDARRARAPPPGRGRLRRGGSGGPSWQRGRPPRWRAFPPRLRVLAAQGAWRAHLSLQPEPKGPRPPPVPD